MPEKENNRRKSVRKTYERRRSHAFSPIIQTDDASNELDHLPPPPPQPIDVESNKGLEIFNEAAAFVEVEEVADRQEKVIKKRVKKQSKEEKSKKQNGPEVVTNGDNENGGLTKRSGSKSKENGYYDDAESDKRPSSSKLNSEDSSSSNKTVEKLKRSNNSKSKLKVETSEEDSDHNQLLNTSNSEIRIFKSLTNSPLKSPTAKLKLIRLKGGGGAGKPPLPPPKGDKKQALIENHVVNETYVLTEDSHNNSLNGGPFSSTINETDESSKNLFSFTSTVDCPASANSSVNP